MRSARSFVLAFALVLVAGAGSCSGDSASDDSASGGSGGNSVDGSPWVDGNPTSADYDVAVVGAGPAGVAAALSARRRGASVILIEETDWVGGQMTAAAVSTMDGGNAFPSLSGLYADFRERILTRYGAKSVSTCYWSATSTCFEPSVGREVLEQMLSEAGVELVSERRVVSVEKSGTLVTGLVLSNGTSISTAVVIDATETGDVIALSGARYRVGNSTSDALDPSACIQSLTYLAVVKKYPNGVPPELVVATPPPGYAAHLPEFQSVVTATGSSAIPISYPVSPAFHAAYRGLPDSSNPANYDGTQYAAITKTGVNWANDYPGYVISAGAAEWSDTLKVTFLEDASVRRSVSCQAKLATLGFVYYLQNELGEPSWSVANDEGYDTPYNESQHCPEVPAELVPLERHLPPMPYVRESRRLVAVTTLTAKDLWKTAGIASKGFSSSIAVGDYPTDLHNCASDATLESSLGEVAADAAPGGWFQVPIETLVPESMDGLLAAEKNIGVSRLAAGAIRLQPIAMLVGEAVGVLAAIAVESQTQPRAVRAVDVQRELLEHSHALSRFPYDDVPLTSPYWKAVQLVSTHEVMIGTSTTHFDLTNSLTRGQAAVVIARLFDLDVSNPPTTPTFSDVPASSPEYAAIEAFAKSGFTSGCSAAPKEFCPDSPATRAQLAVFLVKGLGLDLGTAPTTPLYDDIASNQFFPYIQLAAQEQLIGACVTSPQSFCPDDPVSRGDAALAAYAVLIR